jgi:GT2 family glycosyltransferase
MNRLAIMIVCWNNADDVVECLESLLVQQTQNMTLLCVDNDSSDNSVQQLQVFMDAHKKHDIQLIETCYNGGTAGGFNAGVKWAIDHDYDYIGTLNADAIADKHWVASLVTELKKHPRAGIATGKLLRRDGKTIDTTGDFYTTWGLPGPRLRDQPTTKAPSTSGEVFGSTGGGFIARTAMFRDVGLFDETFFMYYEDVDLCFRAQLRSWTAHYSPDAVAYHKLGASSSTVPGLATYNTFKNLPMLFVKNVPLRLCFAMYPRFVLAYTLILGNAIAHGRGGPALKGWLMSWCYLPHMIRERWRIQHSRTVSVEYINGIILHDIPPDQTGLRRFRQFFTGKP